MQNVQIKLSALPPAPIVYAKSLALLRAVDASGQWPEAKSRRVQLLQGNRASSFTMGRMPPPLRPPRANSKFPELLCALHALQKAIFPNEPANSTIVINKHAQFKPHKDSGAGAGQGISLIVGLGDYVGGELMCEPLGGGPAETFPIRYQPLKFHGWQQRHWTKPFHGERYSIVWFTPLGL